jgi:hypothetical protein
MTMTTNDEFGSRADFLAPDERRFKVVTLPVSGKRYRIRSLTEGEKEAYEAGNCNAKGDFTKDTVIGARRRLIALCLCDGKGDRILTDADVDGIKIKNSADMEYLQQECQAHIGFDGGQVQDKEKNSESVPAAD